MVQLFVTNAINSERENPTRHWCFTLNNYNEGEENGAWLPDSEYWVIGKEKGESGTPHLQGYVVFMDRYRLKQITDSNPTAKRCHWEQQSRFSTPIQAADYCKKERDFKEHGEWYLLACEIDDPDYELESSSSDCSSSNEESEESSDEHLPETPPRRTKTCTFSL